MGQHFDPEAQRRVHFGMLHVGGAVRMGAREIVKRAMLLDGVTPPKKRALPKHEPMSDADRELLGRQLRK